MTTDQVPPNIRRNWLLLGFRLGQLVDIVRPGFVREVDDPPLVYQLLVKLRLAAGSCITDPDPQAQLLGTISYMQGIWQQGAELDREHGDGKTFELIHNQLLQIEPTFRELAVEAQDLDWFDVGRLLGKSSGWCIDWSEGGDESETCWNYRDHDALIVQLLSLGTNLETVSGLPETDEAKVLISFLNRQPVDAPIMKRYPQHRWGWAFIEERFLPKPLPGSDSKTKSDEDRPDEQLERTSETQTPVIIETLPTKLTPGYLGLIVDETNKKTKIRRLNQKNEVELSEDRLWNLFLRYFRAQENYLSKQALEHEWDQIGNIEDPSSNSVSAANSDLRKKLKVLQVDVAAKKNERNRKMSEWRLESLNPANDDD